VRSFVAVVLLSAAGFRCGATTPSPPAASPAGSASSPEAFELHPGEKITAAGGELTVTFLAVLEDSRCPKGEQCIQAGRARLSFEAVPRGGEPARFELVTSTDDSEAVMGHFRIAFRGIDPYPIAGRPIAPNDYVARISVQKF
jgi:hypothetical protein